jgi:hypothetical protein
MGKFILIALVLAVSASVAQADTPALSPTDYMARGMPAVDRLWIGDDYAAAARVLQQLDASQLPRGASPNSGAVMARLIDPGNLDFCDSSSTPVAARMQPCLTMMKATSDVLKLYYAAFLKDRGFADDMAGVAGYLIEVSASEAGLMDEFLPMLDKNDPSYARRMAGVEQARGGLAEIVQGMLLVASDRQTLSDTARIKLAAIIAASYPRIATQLPPLSKIEFDKTLRRMAQIDPSAGVRAALAPFAAEK